MTELKRPGKHTVRPGDTVRVSGTELDIAGIVVKDRGWSGGKVLRLLPVGDDVLVEVTVPGKAGTRTVPADRVTRMRSAS